MSKNDSVWYLLTSLGAGAMLLSMVALFTGGSGFMLFGFAALILLGA